MNKYKKYNNHYHKFALYISLRYQFMLNIYLGLGPPDFQLYLKHSKVAVNMVSRLNSVQLLNASLPIGLRSG